MYEENQIIIQSKLLTFHKNKKRNKQKINYYVKRTVIIKYKILLRYFSFVFLNELKIVIDEHSTKTKHIFRPNTSYSIYSRKEKGSYYNVQ